MKSDVSPATSLVNDRFYIIFNQTFEFLAFLQPDGTVLDVNQPALQFGGFPAAAIIGKPFWEGRWWALTPAIQDRVRQSIAEAGGGSFVRYEVDFLGGDNSVITIDFSLKPVTDKSGKVVFLLAEGRDITELKQTEKALCYRIELEKLHSTISAHFINLAPEAINRGIYLALQKIGEFLQVDRSYVFLFFENGKFMSNTHEWCAPGIDAQIHRVQGVVGDEAFPYFSKIIKNLEVFWVPRVEDLPAEAHLEKREFQRQKIQSVLNVPMVIRDKLVGFLGLDSVRAERHWSDDVVELLRLIGAIFVNALERKEVQEDLHRSEERLRYLIQSSPAVIYSLDHQKQWLTKYFSSNILSLLGFTPEEALADPEFWIKHVAPEDMRQVLDMMPLLNPGQHYHGEYRFLHKDGSYRWIHDEANIIDLSEGRKEAVGCLLDITERKRVEEQLSLTLAELALKNQKLQDAYAELKISQNKILQQEKLASIGRLAAGIAHEINNPLAFISSNLEILSDYIQKLTDFIAWQTQALQSTSSPESIAAMETKRQQGKLDYIFRDLPELFQQSLEGTRRVKKIIQDLKTFAGMRELEFKMADVNSGLDSIINIVWNEIKYKACVKKELGKLPQTRCNLGQLNQVFMNLLVNAAQSIENQGEVTIKTWNDDKHIYVSISDTGRGIAAEHMPKLFEPFFTTKEVGKGMGLGLTLTYDIVKKHQGEILVSSELGKGSTFTVKIPIQGEEQ